MSKEIVLRFNTRNYEPAEWEAWCESQVIAHARDCTLLEEKFPQASIIEPRHRPYVNARGELIDNGTTSAACSWSHRDHCPRCIYLSTVDGFDAFATREGS